MHQEQKPEPQWKSCPYCRHMEYQGVEGDHFGFKESQPICLKEQANKPGFPFTTPQPCFVMNYWTAIQLDEDVSAAYAYALRNGDLQTTKAYDVYVRKYGLR